MKGYQNQRRETKQKAKRKKRTISARFLWLILFLASIVFGITFWRMPMFPTKWKLMVIAGLAVLDWITFFLTSKMKPANVFAQVMNTLFILALIVMNVILPYYTERFTNLFTSVLGNEVKISLYVMSDAYKDAHPDIFGNHGFDEDMKLSEYTNATFITATYIDGENQRYVLEKLASDIGNTEPVSLNSTSVLAAVNHLYTNRGDVLILSDSFLSGVLETEEYKNFKEETKVIGSYLHKVDTSGIHADQTNLANTPFTLFIAGNDQPGGLSLQGRTDVDIAVSVNPNTHQIMIVNMPRDSFIANPAYQDKRDKLTHLGLSGLQNTLQGLSNLYDTDVKHYLLVNFTTFVDIVDAIGGITIDNPFEFTTYYTLHTFSQGTLDLNGELALEYVRERYNLPNGDFDRNMHQQIVLSAIIQKMLSPELIGTFNHILSALEGKFLTNISTDSIYALCKKQLDENIDWNIVKYHLAGETGNEYCASAPDQLLSVVYLYDNQVKFIKEEMEKVLSDVIISQETLPDGEMNETVN